MALNAVVPIYTAQAGLTQAVKSFEKAAESVASGVKSFVNPADLYVAQGLDTAIRSAQKAIENAQTGYNYTATADSALGNVTENLQRIKELSTQAANGVYSDSQRAVIQAEINQNVEQINQTLGSTTFNGKQVINPVTPANPTPVPTVDFMVGSDTSSVVSYDPNMPMGAMTFDVSTPDAARASMAQAEAVIGGVNEMRGSIGATQARLEGAISQQQSAILSSSQSLSDIQDTDYVSAIADMKKSQFTMEAMAKVMKTVMNADRYVLQLLK